TNRFVELQLEGFRPPGPEAFAALIRRVIADDSCHCLIASIDGTDAGVAGVTVYKHSGCLIAGTTLEAHRRRGVQTALIIERLRIARDAGCTHICVGSSPTVATGRNAIRLGFVPAYTKATLVHPRPGLVPSE
ncbi:MAG: GNAT family N-acetyltransferase, partial [Phycisphaerales bacterium]|nr:GNAT family N-acetyltransferase [Phycisphaerales bacterium]